MKTTSRKGAKAQSDFPRWKRGCGLTKFQVEFYRMIARERRRRKRGFRPVVVDCLRMLEVEAVSCRPFIFLTARDEKGRRIFN